MYERRAPAWEKCLWSWLVCASCVVVGTLLLVLLNELRANSGSHTSLSEWSKKNQLDGLVTEQKATPTYSAR